MDKGQLISSLNRLDVWLIAFGVLVAIGVVGESVVGFLHWRRSNQLQTVQEAENLTLSLKVADANARALEAQVALARFRAPRQVTDEQGTQISGALGQFAKTPFCMSMVVGDNEAFGLLAQIASVLEHAGWHWVDWNPPGGAFMFVYKLEGKPNVGQDAAILGVRIEVHADHFASLEAPTEALVKALNEAGIKATSGPASAEAPNHGAINIRIGKKPTQ